MRKFRWVLSAVMVGCLLVGAIGAAQGASTPFPEQHKELLSGSAADTLFGADQGTPAGLMQGLAVQALAAAAGGSSVVGPNVRVNAAQTSLLGRSETTIATSVDGTKLVAGWNDAQGFC